MLGSVELIEQDFAGIALTKECKELKDRVIQLLTSHLNNNPKRACAEFSSLMNHYNQMHWAQAAQMYYVLKTCLCYFPQSTLKPFIAQRMIIETEVQKLSFANSGQLLFAYAQKATDYQLQQGRQIETQDHSTADVSNHYRCT